MTPTRLSLRLGLAVSALCAVLVLVLATLSYATIAHQLDLRARNALNEKLGQIEHSLAETPQLGTDLTLHSHNLRDQIAGHDHLELTLLDARSPYQRLLQLGDDDGIAVALPSIGGGAQGFERQRLADGHERLIAARRVSLRDGQQVIALLSLDTRDDSTLLRAYVTSSLVALPLILLLVGGGAWWLVRRALRPLKALRKAASRVSARDLSQRMEVEGLPDELRELARAMNLMLQRLEDDIRQLAQFSDDLAHELRSPMNNLLGKAQVTLARERPADEYKQALESCTEELERLSRMVSQMLFLASVTQPSAAAPCEPVDLREEASKVAELFSLAAEDKQMQIQVSGHACTRGDRLMIQRALSNLLSNAIRHGTPGSTVNLHLARPDQTVTVEVSNQGEGISAEHLPRLFDRFYRVQASRARHEGGTGLGLAIVRSIMSLHDGEVRAHSQPGQTTTFTLIFTRGPAYLSPPEQPVRTYEILER